MSGAAAYRFALRRVAWGIAVVWATLTACFLILWTLPETRFVGGGVVKMGLAATDVTTDSLLSSYVAWMEAFLTGEWGHSTYYSSPWDKTSVVSIYANRTPITLVYLVPGVLASVAVGTLLTTYATVDRDGYLHKLVSVVGAVGLSVPSFVIVWMLLVAMYTFGDQLLTYEDSLGLWTWTNVLRLQISTAVIALTFTAVQVRHVQAETVDHLEEAFVKTAKAKGAGRLRVARHVFRNAWPSIASLVQGEALGFLLLTVLVVEYTFRIPGIGRAVYFGFGTGDPMLSFTAVFFLVTLGVVGTLARDFARIALDPQYGG